MAGTLNPGAVLPSCWWVLKAMGSELTKSCSGLFHAEACSPWLALFFKTNPSKLLTHKDQTSQRNSGFWLLWTMEDLAAPGPHSEQGPRRGCPFRTGMDMPPGLPRPSLLTSCLPGGQLSL